jgi:hypothetical protein
MAWRFRKSFKVLPGVRLNVSTRGVSTSIGGAPFTVNIGSRGVHQTLSIPGTGLSMRGRIDQPSASPQLAPSASPSIPGSTPSQVVDVGEAIRSAGTDVMTSAGLAEFKTLLMQAGRECLTLTGEIETMTPRATKAKARQQRWDRGFFFRHVRKSKFAAICEEAESIEAQLSELHEQHALARLATEITVDRNIAEPYSRMCDSFAAMTKSQRIWDTLTRKANNQATERTAATQSITRELVTFNRGQSDILSCEWEVPCLQNRSGGDMYLYPAFVLYRVTSDTFAVIDVQDVTMEYVPFGFIEREEIPADSPIINHTWLKVNKNGTPDKRFKDNVQVPIVQYAILKLKSPTGLNEEYMLSSAPLCENFAKEWAAFRQAFGPAKQQVLG